MRIQLSHAACSVLCLGFLLWRTPALAQPKLNNRIFSFEWTDQLKSNGKIVGGYRLNRFHCGPDNICGLDSTTISECNHGFVNIGHLSWSTVDGNLEAIRDESGVSVTLKNFRRQTNYRFKVRYLGNFGSELLDVSGAETMTSEDKVEIYEVVPLVPAKGDLLEGKWLARDLQCKVSMAVIAPPKPPSNK